MHFPSPRGVSHPRTSCPLPLLALPPILRTNPFAAQKTMHSPPSPTPDLFGSRKGGEFCAAFSGSAGRANTGFATSVYRRTVVALCLPARGSRKRAEHLGFQRPRRFFWTHWYRL